MVAKWICTDAALVAWTPPEIVPVLTGLSSLTSTNVAPASMRSPPLMVTGPLLRQTAPSGTTTRWKVPAARVPVQVVDEVAAPATPGTPTSSAPASAATYYRRTFPLTSNPPLLALRPQWTPLHPT